MSTATHQPPLRASWRARVWTWIVSIVLTFSALGCALIVGAGVHRMFGGVLEVPPPPLPGSPPGFAVPILIAVGAAWLVALGLHAYASRRRRMSLAHILVPAVVFALGVFLASQMTPASTSL